MESFTKEQNEFFKKVCMEHQQRLERAFSLIRTTRESLITVNGEFNSCIGPTDIENTLTLAEEILNPTHSLLLESSITVDYWLNEDSYNSLKD